MSLTSGDSAEPQRRRRGPELEKALLKAAWDELFDVGYEELTFEAVAERASTSRAVLYRRWTSKKEMVEAAIADFFSNQRPNIPDTGSLRGDMVQMLETFNGGRAKTSILLLAQLGTSGAEDSFTLARIREFVAGSGRARIDAVLGKAYERGEITTVDIPARAKSIALDLNRHDLLVTNSPISRTEVEEIVDSIFIPLMRYYAGYSSAE